MTCLLQNVTDILLDSIFNNLTNNVEVLLNNVTGLCEGLYDFELEIFGNKRKISDTWNMTITDATLVVLIGLRTQVSKVLTYLPSITYQGSRVENGNVSLNVNGNLAQTFGSLILPGE